MTDGGAYLDTSAALKLLVVEAETEALARFLRGWPVRASSELLSVELLCACRRRGLASADAEQLLATVTLIPLSASVLRRAGEPFAPAQRALDAVHLAAAEHARQQLGCLVTYDVEQAAAAKSLGWRIEQPA